MGFSLERLEMCLAGGVLLAGEKLAERRINLNQQKKKKPV